MASIGFAASAFAVASVLAVAAGVVLAALGSYGLGAIVIAVGVVVAGEALWLRRRLAKSPE